MTPPDDSELPDSVAISLEPLPREIPSPPALEARVLDELRRRGLVAPRRALSTRWWAAAAALVLFTSGLLVGRGLDGARRFPPDPGPEFLLLLYEPRPLVGGFEVEARRVAEYGAWAGDLARQGRLVAAEKLADASLRVSATADGEDSRGEPTGFFLVRAAGLDEALAIARGCPHVAHGGEVRVRPVDPT